MTRHSIIIGDVESFSIVDFPNHIAAVVFMQGCPWRCPFCYNASLQKIGAIPESDWTFEKLLAFLNKRKGVLDSVVFSGGEPLVQDNLSEAVDAVKNLGYCVGLHTGGYRPDALAKIMSQVDWVGLDIKAPLNHDRYAQATGGQTPPENIKKSLDILIKSGKPFECRTTCDPRILTVEDIYQIADFLKNMGVKEYYIQKYRPIPSDTTTSDEMCSKIVENPALVEYLQKSFELFAVRQ